MGRIFAQIKLKVHGLKRNLRLAPPADPGLERAILRTEGNPIYRGHYGPRWIWHWIRATGPRSRILTGARMPQVIHGQSFACGRLCRRVGQEVLSGRRHSFTLGPVEWPRCTGFLGHSLSSTKCRTTELDRNPARQAAAISGSRTRKWDCDQSSIQSSGCPIGAIGTFTAINVGPGTASQFISSDRQYGLSVAPVSTGKQII